MALIKDLSDGKRKFAKYIQQYERDELTTEKFRSLIYGLSKYMEAVYKADIESELEKIKERLENETNKRN